jgi:pyrimidine-nucleoside phosphorylase
MQMTALAIIAKKRDGFALTSEEIHFFITAYLQGTIPDYQMSAWLMAIYLRGMDPQETAILTQAMLDSGSRINLKDIRGIKIDKHSTGGVGDKVSLILAPLMAAAGVKVPMISGRSLGHTGGTLDKLESIPGFRTDLAPAAFHDQVRDLGVAMIGQTADIVPADKKIYALRDSTATVASIPLITASILSKKLAEGIDGLVMDIKCGKGAFMTDLGRAETLAQSIIRTAALHNLPTVALITEMSQPLGYAAGNWLEVREVLQALQGHGPEDLMQVTYALGVQMMALAKMDGPTRQAVALLQKTITNGAALQKFYEMVAAQGGDVRFLHEPGSYPGAKMQQHVRAARTGFVTEIDALKIGEAVVRLGGGRTTLADLIDPATGVVLGKKIGDEVRKGEMLAVIHANRPAAAREAIELVRPAFVISAEPVPKPKTILKIIRS